MYLPDRTAIRTNMLVWRENRADRPPQTQSWGNQVAWTSNETDWLV